MRSSYPYGNGRSKIFRSDEGLCFAPQWKRHRQGTSDHWPDARERRGSAGCHRSLFMCDVAWVAKDMRTQNRAPLTVTIVHTTMTVMMSKNWTSADQALGSALHRHPDSSQAEPFSVMLGADELCTPHHIRPQFSGNPNIMPTRRFRCKEACLFVETEFGTMFSSTLFVPSAFI